MTNDVEILSHAITAFVFPIKIEDEENKEEVKEEPQDAISNS